MAVEPRSEAGLIRALSEDLALEILASYASEDFADAGFTSLGEAAVYLRPVGLQDFHLCSAVLQARDGPLRFDRRPMGEDGTAVSGQATRSRTQPQGQSPVCRSRAV